MNSLLDEIIECYDFKLKKRKIRIYKKKSSSKYIVLFLLNRCLN